MAFFNFIYYSLITTSNKVVNLFFLFCKSLFKARDLDCLIPASQFFLCCHNMNHNQSF